MKKENESAITEEAGEEQQIPPQSESDRDGYKKFSEEEKHLLLRMVVFHLGMALLSMIVTGSFTKLEGVMFLLVPVVLLIRSFSMLLFTLPVYNTPYRQSLTVLMSALWLLWQGASTGRMIESVVTVIPVAAAAVTLFIVHDRKNPQKQDRFTPWIKKITLLLYISLSIIIVIELLQTCSIIKTVKCLPTQPDILALNLLLFTALGSFVLWIKRPVIGGIIYSLFWLVFGIASMIKNLNIYEPVLFLDLFQSLEGISAAFDIIGIFGLVMIVAGIVAVVVSIVIIAVKGKKHVKKKINKRVMWVSLIFMFAGVLCCILSAFLPWIDFSGVSARELFDRNGYVYSFVTTAYRSGKKRPDNYNNDDLSVIIEKVNKEGEKSRDSSIDGMNIIVLQIESFMDPYDVEGVTYDRDPIPFIHSLSERYTSGIASVPIYGGMTVKSEFEFLTGLNLDNLPYGYNPYMLYLNSTPMDSLPRYLSESGFNTVGIHDYQGEFFKRTDVYKNLGFDCFSSYEFMPGVEKKELSIWSNDAILLDQIKTAIDTSDSDNNFIFAVTVQTHGAYKEIDESEYTFDITGVEDSSTMGKYEYYLGQLELVDGHVKAICEYFEQTEVPTMILMYSDHLPTFALELPGYTDENRFQVHYYTWNNFGLPKEEIPEVELYQLSTYLCDWLNMDGSFMNRFHRLYMDSEDYSLYLEQVQYYKMYEEPETAAFDDSEFTLGLFDLAIYDIEYDSENDEYIIHGSGLTDNTYLCINGKTYDMQFVDPHTMKWTSPKREITEEDTVTLRIIGEKYGGMLKESKAYEWG